MRHRAVRRTRRPHRRRNPAATDVASSSALPRKRGRHPPLFRDNARVGGRETRAISISPPDNKMVVAVETRGLRERRHDAFLFHHRIAAFFPTHVSRPPATQTGPRNLVLLTARSKFYVPRRDPLTKTHAAPRNMVGSEQTRARTSHDESRCDAAETTMVRAVRDGTIARRMRMRAELLFIERRARRWRALIQACHVPRDEVVLTEWFFGCCFKSKINFLI